MESDINATYQHQWIIVSMTTLIQHPSHCNIFHYLDDFFTAGLPGSPVCKNNFQTMLNLCDKLGPPVKPEKVEGSTTLKEFLCILFNMAAGISPARKAELMDSRMQETQPIVAALVCLQGSASGVHFPLEVDRLQLYSETTPSLATSHQGNTDRSTVVATLSPKLVGTSLMLDSEWTLAPAMQLYMDASSTLGYGAYWQEHWLNGKWTTNQQVHSIQWKELYVIVAAAQTPLVLKTYSVLL